jgi:nucleotide-binding universal stress UspA family protein
MQPVDIKRVLAGVDFSDWTGPVLKTAAEVAGRYGAKLTAVYAETFLPPPYFTHRGMDQIAGVLEIQKDEARRYLVDTVHKEIGGQAALETLLLEATPVEGILMAAEEKGAGLIALGTHGRSGLNRLLLGSVAERVVRGAKVPVLTVRGGAAAACRMPFRKILCPVNYTEVARDSLRYAADLARRFGAELTVMTSLEGGADGAGEREQERRLCDWIPEEVQAHCTLRPVVRRGDAAEQVLRMAKEEGSDLVVIGAQHRPLLETTIFGTTSVRVMRHAACPVLTVVRH